MAKQQIPCASRSDALPQTPVLADFVPGYEVTAWYGIGAPKGTPLEIVDKLNKEINAGLNDTKIKARLAELGSSRDGRRPCCVMPGWQYAGGGRYVHFNRRQHLEQLTGHMFEPDVPISGIRLSDWFHREAHSGAVRGRRSRRSRPRSP
jgi:hypothetical protein